MKKADMKTVPVTVLLTPLLYKKVKAIAEAGGLSMSTYLRRLAIESVGKDGKA